MRTLRCVGPQVLCVLLDGGHCPLHEEADIAIYDRSTVTPERRSVFCTLMGPPQTGQGPGGSFAATRSPAVLSACR